MSGKGAKSRKPNVNFREMPLANWTRNGQHVGEDFAVNGPYKPARYAESLEDFRRTAGYLLAGPERREDELGIRSGGRA